MDDTIFRKFRSKQGEVWQLESYESPLWTAPDEGGQPFRPQRAVCRSVRTGRHVMSLAGPGEPGPEMFREVVVRAARAWRLRPERIPYLWARGGLAKVLWSLGAREEAVGHFQGMLAVDAGDHERTRYPLASALLALGRDEEVEDLLTRFKEDRPEGWYARALLTFRQEGDSPAARRHLAAALRSDRRVAKQLLSPTRTSREESGRENTPKWEDDVILFLDAWTETPGAVEWLRAQNAGSGSAASARPSKAKKRNKKKKGKRRR